MSFASASVDPMKIGVGARSLAMGRTNLAAPGDINAIFVNPANAAYLDNWGLTSMYTSLLEGDINYTLLGGGKKFDFGGMGLAFLSGGSSGITVTTRDADGRVISAGTSFDYSNSVIALSWGKMIQENLAGGAVLKSYSKAFSSYDSGTGFDLDLGVLFEPKEKLKVGFALQNVLPTGISWTSGTSDDVPMLAKAGLEYPVRDDILVAADMDLSPVALHAGAEWMLNKNFALRGGFDQVPAGTDTALNLCLGMGINMRGFTFDYAYYNDAALAVNSTHYFTLGYLAPSAEKKEEIRRPLPPPPIKEAPAPAPAPKPKSEMALKIEAYILQLEAKLKDAGDPARRVKLQGMIEEQKVRLQKELSE